MSLEPFLEKA